MQINGFKSFDINKFDLVRNIENDNNKVSNSLKLLNCDTVQFSGAVRLLTNACDKAFVNILSKDLNLDEKTTVNLKNTVWNFLRENKVGSLGELGGDEHFDRQVELQERITKILSIDENDETAADYIAEELVSRFENGENYVPRGLSGYFRNLEVDNIFFNQQKISQGMEQLFENAEDDAFYQFVKKMLRHTPEESYEFRETVNEYLRENNLKSIKELSQSQNIDMQIALLNRLEQNFDLSDTETLALEVEFHNRGNVGLVYRNYKPEVSPNIKDVESIIKILKNCGLKDYKAGHSDFGGALYDVMSEEAEQKGLKNIFELLNPENNFNQSRTFKFLREKSGLSEEQQADLIIEMDKVARDPEEFTQSIPKHALRDNLSALFNVDRIVQKIAQEFGMNDILEYGTLHATADKLRNEIYKLYPEHVPGGKNCDIKQVVFEIAETYRLPAGAEKTIEKIINETGIE